MKRVLLLTALAAAVLAPGLATAQTATDSLLARAAAGRTKGAADAPITIIELSDFQCPFYARFATTTLPLLDSAYVATGQVRIIFFNFPAPAHARAWVAAEAAMCAAALDAFWPMHDLIFARQAAWSTADRPHEHFAAYAAEVGLDAEEFRTCVEHDLVAPLISGDLMQSAGSGARGTPTFIINGERVLSGAEPFSVFQTVIEEVLAEGDGG